MSDLLFTSVNPLNECKCCKMLLLPTNTSGYCTTFCQDKHEGWRVTYRERRGRKRKSTAALIAENKLREIIRSLQPCSIFYYEFK